MLFSRKSNPQKIFDYKQFTIINKEFRKNFKSIFNTLDYFNNSVLKITSLELPSLLIDIEDFVYRLNQSYLEESNYDSRAIYSYINNLNQKAIIIEIKTSKKIEKLMTLYIDEEVVTKLHYDDFKELLKEYYTKSIFLENFFEKLDKKVIETTENQIKKTQNNKGRTHDECDQVFEYVYEKDDNNIKYQIFFMDKLISSFMLCIK